MCSNRAPHHNYKHGDHHENWERAQEKFNEFSEKITTYLKSSPLFDQDSSKPAMSISLQDGRSFSLSLGHIVLIGLLLIILPAGLLIVAGLIAAAYFSNNRPKSEDSTRVKGKLKNPSDDFEVFNV